MSWRNKEKALEKIKKDRNNFNYAHSSLQKDKEVVLVAVKQCGGAFYCADSKSQELMRNYKKTTNKLSFLMDWGEAWTKKLHKELVELREKLKDE